MADELIHGHKRGPKPGTENAKRGGQAVVAKYGCEHFSQIGKKGGQTAKEQNGAAHYTKIGHQGGEATKARYGIEHFVRIGRMGGMNRGKSKGNASAEV
jgi:general stress protein YciG